MRLIIVYFILLAIGLTVSIAAGFVGDEWSSTFGLIVFLSLFFLTLWLGWVAAVKLTDERGLLRETKGKSARS